ncbi:beta-phosphoglucomutase-like phosphatase (HAD superfamily) [Bradyrhizobium sp. LM3.6]
MFGQSERAAVTGGIKLVLFDMDNVLCDYDRGKRVAWLAKLAGATSEFVHKAIWDSGFELLGDSGHSRCRGLFAGFRRAHRLSAVTGRVDRGATPFNASRS